MSTFTPPFGAPAGIGGGMPQQSTTPMPQQATASTPERIVIGPVVLSYPSLDQPKQQDGDKDPQYGAELYIYQDNPAINQILGQLQNAVNYVVQAKWPNGAPRFPHSPIRNLSEKDPQKYTGPPGLFLRANSTQRPWLGVGRERRPPQDSEEIYAGCLVYVGLTASAYQFKDDKGMEVRGVKWYLNSVLKVGDGPKLSGRVDSSKDFDGVMDGIQFQFQQPQAPQQQAGVYPPQQMPGYPPQQMPGYPQQQPMPQGYVPQQAAFQPPQMVGGYPPQTQMPPGYPPQGAQPGWGPQW